LTPTQAAEVIKTMSIESITPSATGDTGLYQAQATSMGKDDFLTLLITQLQNQDPLNPTDSTEFTAQLAQFSSLEQLSNVNQNLEYLQLYQASLNNAQAVAFIGKEVIAQGNGLQLKDGAAEACAFELAAAANGVVVNIYDGAGNFVKAIEEGAMSAGRQSVVWDGKNQNGNPVADGNYTFEVMAVDADDKSVQTTTFTSGVVSGVTFNKGTTYFILDNQQIPIGDVIEVAEVAASET
jgi:flagellar basal-body rod modification protein FlgD